MRADFITPANPRRSLRSEDRRCSTLNQPAAAGRLRGCLPFAALLPLLLATGLQAQEGPDLPVVPEQVDQLVLVHLEGTERAYVVFCRDQQVIATRPVTDQMFWNASEGKFQLIWNDGWRVERVVTADTFEVFYEMDEEHTGLSEHLPWWSMFRNMRDLKAP